MSYQTYRKAKIEGYYDHQLESLMSGFDPYQPTVILLPGGMGSQLERTEHPVGTEPNVINDIVWIDLGIILPPWDALKLEIDAQERDTDLHVVAAHGPLKFFTQTPYGELENFAQRQGWNYCVFAFDWRRSLAESAEFFKAFIYKFRRRVLGDYRVDPISNLTIVCHSMGGLVCTYALRSSGFSRLGFRAIVTVGTPFYGTSTQQDRYFRGEEDFLNVIYGAEAVVKVTASLPGPYTLMFLPKEIFMRDGRRLGLRRYPQYDPQGGFDTDPYDPNLTRRWPKPVRDHRQYIARARSEFLSVAQPISPNIAPVFFNVRSSLDGATAVELRWNNVDGDDVIPGDTQSPLAGIPGPGDGTVPAWSAWHAYSRPANRHELRQASAHGTLLEHGEVLSLIRSIVETRKLPTSARGIQKRSAPIASAGKIARVIDSMVARPRQSPPKELFEKPVQRAIVSRLLEGKKPRMVRRPKST